MKKIKLYGYEIYEDGTIISLSGKPMAYSKTIDLTINGKSRSVSYARIIYYAFHPDFDFNNHSYTVKHKDKNIKNNHIDNLYITNEKIHLRGENNKKSKLTDKEAEEIRRIYFKDKIENSDKNKNNPFKKVSYRKLAEKYGVSHNLIKNIIKGITRN